MRYLILCLVFLILYTGCVSTPEYTAPATASQATLIITSTPTAVIPQKVLHLTGTGDDVQSFTATGTGIRIFAMQYSGEHNFIVRLQDSNGRNVELLANEIGSYSGKSSEPLGAGIYYLEVKASGPWTIDITS